MGSHEGTEENSSTLGTLYARRLRHRQAQCISPDVVQTYVCRQCWDLIKSVLRRRSALRKPTSPLKHFKANPKGVKTSLHPAGILGKCKEY